MTQYIAYLWRYNDNARTMLSIERETLKEFRKRVFSYYPMEEDWHARFSEFSEIIDIDADDLDREYENALNLYGVRSPIWGQLHESFSRYIFCDANKKSIISEYLFWERLTERMKKHNKTYYYGIDEFLKAYKDAVYECLNI